MNSGFLGLLTIVLLILEAFKVIQIGWLWVFAPIWIPIAIVLVVWLGVFVFALFTTRNM